MSKLSRPVKLTQEIAKINTRKKELEEPLVNILNYPNPINLKNEIAKLQTKIKQLKSKKSTKNTALFTSYNRNLRAVDDEPICNNFKKWAMQKEIVDKIYTISDIGKGYITVTCHCTRHATREGVLLLIEEGVQTINTCTQGIIHSKTH